MPGLRERKKADTRRALSDAALELAVEHGFENVTREAIANLAGVSLRTFNNYFSGKYEALAFRITERMRRKVVVFRERPADEPLWTSLSEAIVGVLDEDLGSEDDVADRRELAEVRKIMLSNAVRSAAPQDLFDDWIDAIAERTGTDPEVDLYPRLVVAVIRAVGDAAMETYARSGSDVTLAELIRSGLAAVAAGLPEPRSVS